jgi:hypothetical protein
MPRSLLDEVVVLRFKGAEGARQLLSAHGDELEAIILDPMPSRRGLTTNAGIRIRGALQPPCQRRWRTPTRRSSSTYSMDFSIPTVASWTKSGVEMTALTRKA